MRILAKPRFGKSNLINDRLYGEIEQDSDIEVFSWSPLRMLLCRYDILHVHWPENVLNERVWLCSVVKVIALMFALAWIKLYNRKLIWTAHNVVSHDAYHPKLESFFWAFFIPQVDGIIALSEESLAQVRKLRNLPTETLALVVPHGNYCGVYPDDISRDRARARLDLDSNARVLLNLGLVRRYKKVERLVDFAHGDSNTHIVIAGRVGESDYEEELKTYAAGLSNVHLHFKFIPDDQLQVYLRAADLFVLPYDEITNSGSAVLALTYDLPVLAPNLLCFEELKARFGQRWISTYSGVLNCESVETFLAERDRECETKCVDWGEWEWTSIAERIRQFYKLVIQK